jgi:hypothetical protein
VIHAFDITPNELTTTGRSLDVTSKALSRNEALLIDWIDRRIRNADWYKFARHYKGSGKRVAGDADLAYSRLSIVTGITKATLLNHPYREFLQELLNLVSENGLLNTKGPYAIATTKIIAKKWAALRRKLLDHRHDRVVDVTAWSHALEQRYLGYVAAHFRENFKQSSKGTHEPVRSPAHSAYDAQNTLLSEQLIVVWDLQFSGFKNKGMIPRPLMRHDLYNYLRGDNLKETIFKRLDIRDETGSHVAITPHQIRHWVTTAKMRSGASQMMVDLWMGRKPGQSRHYDHRSAAERAESVRSIYSAKVVPDDYLGRKVTHWRSRGVSEEEIELLINSKLRVAHFVPWGMCSRELYVAPCTRGLMCLRGFGTASACPSFHVDPSDLEAKKNIENLRSKYVDMLKKIEPNYESLKKRIEIELNDTAPLDRPALTDPGTKLV